MSEEFAHNLFKAEWLSASFLISHAVLTLSTCWLQSHDTSGRHDGRTCTCFTVFLSEFFVFLCQTRSGSMPPVLTSASS